MWINKNAPFLRKKKKQIIADHKKCNLRQQNIQE